MLKLMFPNAGESERLRLRLLSTQEELQSLTEQHQTALEEEITDKDEALHKQCSRIHSFRDLTIGLEFHASTLTATVAEPVPFATGGLFVVTVTLPPPCFTSGDPPPHDAATTITKSQRTS